MRLKYKELSARLAKNDTANLYLFLGDEEYYHQEGIERLKKVLLSPSEIEFCYHLFVGEDATAAAIIEAAQSFPLWGGKQLVVVKRIESLATRELNKLIPMLGRLSSVTTMVFTAKKLKATSFSRQIEQQGVVVDCKPLYDREALHWLKGKAADQGYQLEPPVAGALLEACGNNLGLLAHELEKLFLFVGKGGNITAQTVATVVGNIKSHSIFALLDAIGKKDLEQSLFLLTSILKEAPSALMVLAMITWQLRRLWQVSLALQQGKNDQTIARQVGMQSYLVANLRRQATLFSRQQLQQGFYALLETDLKLKTTSISPKLLLELLLLKLVGFSPIA